MTNSQHLFDVKNLLKTEQYHDHKHGTNVLNVQNTKNH
jgi:hypothetical protein